MRSLRMPRIQLEAASVGCSLALEQGRDDIGKGQEVSMKIAAPIKSKGV